MIATRAESADRELVEAVRAGDDCAFEELYRRYQPRIAAFVRRKVGDAARAEDIAQDVFFSALRRLRATDAEIDFKPWVFQIANNAAIDHWRRTSRAEEISVDADEGMRQSDRVRLTGAAGPDSVLVDKERFDHLRGAFDELSDAHTRILVMRELEGLSYREISERLDVSRASVESTLFRARRRLESEYADISEGRRCVAMRGVIARISEGAGGKREVGRLARHARRCHVCRRRARELGVDPLPRLSGLAEKAAAFLPLPFVLRRGSGGHGVLSNFVPAGGQLSAVVAERTAALVAAAAIAGAGGVAIGGSDVLGGDGGPERAPAVEQNKPGSGTEPGTDRSPATRGHPRPGGVAGGPDPRGGDSRSGRGGDGARPGQGGAGAAGGAGGAGATGTTGAVQGGEAPGAGADVRLPSVPDVPSGAGGNGPGAPSAEPPKLPDPPSPPNVTPPRTPEPPTPMPPTTPRVESAPALPVEPPTAPELPQVDTGAPLDATGIGGG
ncbi:MAG TPA: sigma-70 family RNA polymerase sigma factor [Thermoleophilaceae bacterium]|nr:sigma-70 family RNA polymerase sigma factor [Thermoleophilaceae bacterium]